MKSLLFSLFLIVGFGCDNAFTPEYSLGFEPPVIDRLIIYEPRLEYSYEVSAELPVLNFNGNNSTISFEEIRNFYVNANPVTSSSTNIHFSIPNATHVELFLYPARLPSETKEKVLQRFSGSPFLNLRNGASYVLLDNFMPAGQHQVLLNPQELGMPDGVYIYEIKAGEWNVKRTIYFIKNCELMIPAVRSYFYDNCVENRER